VVEEARENLKCLFAKHVIPQIGSQRMRDMTLTPLQLLVNKLAEDGFRKSVAGQIRTYMKTCFEYAVDEDLIPKSPARKLVMPKIRKKPCERFLSVEEFRALLSHAPQREHVVLRIFAVCGLRPAEVLVLRIEDLEGFQLENCASKLHPYIINLIQHGNISRSCSTQGWLVGTLEVELVKRRYWNVPRPTSRTSVAW
jgi:site-specific recombinase XerD